MTDTNPTEGIFVRMLAALRAKQQATYDAATPEEKARLDEVKRRQDEDDARPRVTVKALRTCAWNDTTREVDVVFVARPGSDGERWLFIEEGGPTGYESVPFDAITEGSHWVACSGTKQRWDRLVVPAESLRAVKDALGTLPPSSGGKHDQ